MCIRDSLNMDVDTSQHLVVRDVSLQGSRLALPGSAAQENMPAEIRQQLDVYKRQSEASIPHKA